MTSYFYSHLVEIDEVLVELDQLNLKDSHKKQLAQLVDSHLHHEIMDVIFSQLSDEEKQLFLEKINQQPQDPQLMEFLKQKTSGIEEKIKLAAKQLKQELMMDIKKSKEEVE